MQTVGLNYNQINCSILYSENRKTIFNDILEANYLFLYALNFDNQYFYDYALEKINSIIKQPLPKHWNEILNNIIIDWKNLEVIENKGFIDKLIYNDTIIPFIIQLRDSNPSEFKRKIVENKSLVFASQLAENVNFQIFADKRCSFFLMNLKFILNKNLDLKNTIDYNSNTSSFKDLNKKMLFANDLISFLKVERQNKSNPPLINKVCDLFYRILHAKKNETARHNDLSFTIENFLDSGSFHQLPPNQRIAFANLFLALFNTKKREPKLSTLPLANFISYL